MLTPPPESPLSSLTGDELRARMAWARVFLVWAHEAPGAETVPGSVLRAHVDYLRRAEAAGLLYAHGPVGPRAGDDVRELAVIAAASADDARRVAMGDPLHRAGYRINVVQGHIINEGVACYVARAMSMRARPGCEVPPADEDLADGWHADGGVETEVHLIALEPTGKVRPAKETGALDAHFVWLREHEMAARLMSCGPVEPAEALGPGVWGGGLGVVATSRAEAEQIARGEPSARAGYRTSSVRGWTVRLGTAAPIARVLRSLNTNPT